MYTVVILALIDPSPNFMRQPLKMMQSEVFLVKNVNLEIKILELLSGSICELPLEKGVLWSVQEDRKLLSFLPKCARFWKAPIMKCIPAEGIDYASTSCFDQAK